jgi:hypothetical protein
MTGIVTSGIGPSTTTSAWAVRAIAFGSRPCRAQKSSSTADLCAMTSGRPQVFHTSAYRATIPSMRRSPPPPALGMKWSAT